MTVNKQTLRLRYAPARGTTIERMRDDLRTTSLYRHGDCKLVWVNEGDLSVLELSGVKVIDLREPAA